MPFEETEIKKTTEQKVSPRKIGGVDDGNRNYVAVRICGRRAESAVSRENGAPSERQ